MFKFHNRLIVICLMGILLSLQGSKTNAADELYSSAFILAPMIDAVIPMKNVSPSTGNFTEFSLQLSKSDSTYDRNLYDSVQNLKILNVTDINFEIFFKDNIVVKVIRESSRTHSKDIWTINPQLIPDFNQYPAIYAEQSKQAFLSLLRQGDFLSYLNLGENVIGIKNIIFGKNSSVIVLQNKKNNLLVTISISNSKIYNISFGDKTNDNSPYGTLIVAITLKNNVLVAGTGRIENQKFDCSFFPQGGLKHYMTGQFKQWNDVIVWNKNGIDFKKIPYNKWAEDATLR